MLPDQQILTSSREIMPELWTLMSSVPNPPTSASIQTTFLSAPTLSVKYCTAYIKLERTSTDELNILSKVIILAKSTQFCS